MKNYFKAVLFTVILLFAKTALPAQNKTLANSFVLVNNKFPEKTAFFTTSISKADMEQYRLREKRVRVEFENGFELELLSAKELFVNGQNININNYPSEHGKGQLPVFSVLQNGYLSAKVFNEQKK